MSRQRAIEIARRCAKAKPQSYYAEPFEPHEWVIDAILEAMGWDEAYQCGNCGQDGCVDCDPREIALKRSAQRT
jgi:hypothetical protein